MIIFTRCNLNIQYFYSSNFNTVLITQGNKIRFTFGVWGSLKNSGPVCCAESEYHFHFSRLVPVFEVSPLEWFDVFRQFFFSKFIEKSLFTCNLMKLGHDMHHRKTHRMTLIWSMWQNWFSCKLEN